MGRMGDVKPASYCWPRSTHGVLKRPPPACRSGPRSLPSILSARLSMRVWRNFAALPCDGTPYVSLMLICRYVQRISRHAANQSHPRPRLALRRLELDESRDIASYGKQIRELGDEPSVAILKRGSCGRRGPPPDFGRTDSAPPSDNSAGPRKSRNRRSMTEEGLSSPGVSASAGALSTAMGAFIPVIPFSSWPESRRL